MAILLSVTVSMLEETMGLFNEMLRDSFVLTFTVRRDTTEEHYKGS
jgi:hypothetical protein